MSARASLLALLAVVLPLLLAQLGARGLNEADEGRYASIACEMMARGDGATPRLYDRAHFNKPPLAYWATAASLRLLGPTEYAARLPSALAALGTILLTWSAARRLFGPAAALAAGLVLATSPMFFVLARVLDPNMLLTACLTLALHSAIRWREGGGMLHRHLFHLAIALGLLVKGPVALVLPALALLGDRLFRPATLPARPLVHGPSMLAALAVGASWFVGQAAQHPELWRFFLVEETLARFFTHRHHREEQVWFFLPVFAGAMLPWIPFLVRGLRRAWLDRRVDPRQRLLGAWVLWPFLLFTLSGSKLPAYLLPVLPPAALLAGAALDGLRNDARSFRALLAAGLTLGWLGGLALAAGAALAYAWPPGAPAVAAPWLLPGLAAAALAILRAPRAHAVVAAAASLALLSLGLHAMAARSERFLGEHTTVKPAALAIRADALRDGDRVAILGVYPRGLSFYLECHPVSQPTYKFPLQIATDAERLRGRMFDESITVHRWFQREPRVYLVLSPKERDILPSRVGKPVRDVYRDARHVVVANFPAAAP